MSVDEPLFRRWRGTTVLARTMEIHRTDRDAAKNQVIPPTCTCQRLQNLPFSCYNQKRRQLILYVHVRLMERATGTSTATYLQKLDAGVVCYTL